MEVINIIMNWFFTGDNGEEYRAISANDTGVKKITYHEPMGEGDAHYADVECKNGETTRYFNLNSVTFK